MGEIISIVHGCMVWIEESVTRVTDWNQASNSLRRIVPIVRVFYECHIVFLFQIRLFDLSANRFCLLQSPVGNFSPQSNKPSRISHTFIHFPV